MSKLISSTLVEIRALVLDEVRRVGLFPSEYTTDRILRLEQSGVAPCTSWSLHEERLSRPIRRQLDSGSVDDLAALYSPPEKLSFLGAFQRGRLVGLATWRLEDWHNTIWLWDIRVHPRARRVGVGRALIESLRGESRRLQARGIMLETQNTNLPAISFYLANGFALVGLNQCLYSEETVSGAEVALFMFWRTTAASTGTES